jgi:dTDP-4-dehydrorhamnose 3,5-epimerase
VEPDVPSGSVLFAQQTPDGDVEAPPRSNLYDFMIYHETPLKGAFLNDLERREHNRGFFARTFCAREFAAHGLNPVGRQSNCSFNFKAGTLRGMHIQVPPAAETKYIRCTTGAIFYAIIDLREDSPTFLQHFELELTAANRRALYVPGMFAIGYQTLMDDTEVHYQVGEFYTPSCERGIRYNDPHFKINWPLKVTEISEKDATWPDFVPAEWKGLMTPERAAVTV